MLCVEHQLPVPRCVHCHHQQRCHRCRQDRDHLEDPGRQVSERHGSAVPAEHRIQAAVDWTCGIGDAEGVDALVRPIVTELPFRGRHEIGDWAERIIELTKPEDRDRRAFWLIWAAERHQQNGDPAAYERLVRPSGDHTFTRFADAYSRGDFKALRQSLSDVVDRLRGDDDHHLAASVEAMSAGPLLGIGRFDRVDDTAARFVEHHREQGPPTLLHWVLQTLGYSAAFQGDQPKADRYFAESIDVEVPEGTLSANGLIRARVMFGRGHHARAFAILRDYIDGLVESDNLVAAAVVAIEFITMTTARRLSEAATVFGYLEATTEFGALASRTLVAETASGVVGDDALAAAVASGRRLDDRRALDYMRGVVDELIVNPAGC